MGKKEEADKDDFRNSVTTVNKQGKRVWLYPKLQKGRLYFQRHTFGYFLLLIMFIGPFLQWRGHPVFLFDILQRIFIIFGVPFFPQDFFLFGVGMICIIVFIALFTAAFGRLFCGWACPQTIFMEMIFRKIEYWVEGDANERRRIDQSKWDFHKVQVKFLKHLIFFTISFIIANLFLSYLVGIKELYKIITEPLGNHIGGFISLVIFSFVFYYVFAVMREQICIVVCPYGRLQSVLLDKDSIVVAYDHVRGEPRGKLNSAENLGDCIDCTLCVQVCPTGIDIRNGTQLECINCAACIDACDQIMTKVNKPTGLIRYASMNQIVNKTKFRITPRLIAYSIIFVALTASVIIGIARRQSVEATILRNPTMLYQVQEDGHITNLYYLSLMNKTFVDIPIDLKLKGIEGSLKIVGQALNVPAKDNLHAVFIVDVSPGVLKSNKNKINIEVYSNNEILSEINTTFIGPVKNIENESDSTSTSNNKLHD